VLAAGQAVEDDAPADLQGVDVIVAGSDSVHGVHDVRSHLGSAEFEAVEH